MISAAKLSMFPFYNILLHIYKRDEYTYTHTPEVPEKQSLEMQKSPISTKKRAILRLMLL
jgi:hypothetical protein